MPEGKRKFVKELIWLFGIAAGIALAFLAINRLSPFGERSLAIHDADIQYLDFFQYYKRLLSGGMKSFYSPGMTLGDSTLALFAYYLSSPFHVLLLFFAEKDYASLFNLLVVMKWMAAALGSFLYLYFRFGSRLKGSVRIWLSCSYMLMQYNVAQAGNVMWLDGVYMLPLMLWGVLRVLRERKISILLILMTALALIFNWYSALINCLFSFFYLLFEFLILQKDFSLKEKGRQIFGILWRYAVAMAIAFLLASFLLVPGILSLRSGRGTIDWKLLQNGFLGNILDVIPRYSLHGQSDKTGVSLYAGSFVLIGCIGYFYQSQRSVREKGITAAMLLLHLLFYYYRPFFVLFSLLKSASSYWFRYSYGTVFLLVWIAASFYTGDQKEERKLWLPLVGWLLAGVLTGHLYPSGFSYSALWMAFTLLVYGAYCLFSVYPRGRILLGALVIAELLGNSRMLISDDGRYSSSTAFAEYTVKQREFIRELQEKDSDFYRVSLLQKRLYTAYGLTAQYNQPLAYGVASLSGYTSDPDSRQRNFLQAVGYPKSGDNMNITGEPLLPVDSLLGIRYFLAEEEREGLPLPALSFHENAYRNPYALPLAFKVAAGAEEEIPNTGDPFLYQNALFERLIGREEKVFFPLSFTVDKKGKKAEYLLPEVPEGRIYYGNISGSSEMDAVLFVGNRRLSYSRWLAPSVFYIGQERQILLESKKEMTIQKEQFYALDLQQLNSVTAQLRSGAASDIRYENGILEFTVAGHRGEHVLLTLPLNDGWEIKDNGERAEYSAFADTFYLIALQEGENRIRMVYRDPGTTEGCLLSAVGLLAVLWLRKANRKTN